VPSTKKKQKIACDKKYLLLSSKIKRRAALVGARQRIKIFKKIRKRNYVNENKTSMKIIKKMQHNISYNISKRMIG
jgi:hypothetical protein